MHSKRSIPSHPSLAHPNAGGYPPLANAHLSSNVVSASAAATVRAPSSPLVHREIRVETASESEVDSHLRSLTKSTTIEELTRTGRTRNLKTLSERDLKEWIKEALRTVISTTTSLGAVEREQLLAKTRTELTAIMIERQAEGHAHAEDVVTLAALTAERDNLAKRLTDTEAKGSGRVADLQRQLTEAIVGRDAIAARVADREARLATALAAPIADPIELTELRGQLEARDAQVAKSDAQGDESQRLAREAMVRLKREQERAFAQKIALTERIDAAHCTNADLDKRRDEAERRAAEAEASLAAAAVEAAAAAELVLATEQRVQSQRTGSAAQLKEGESARAQLVFELVQARTAAAAVQEQLAAALRAAGESRVVAQLRARQSGETLAASEGERQRGAIALLASEANRLGAERGRNAVEDARAGLAGERDRLTVALRTLEAECDAAKRDAQAAGKRAAVAEKAAEKHLLPKSTLPDDVAALQTALLRARSIVTDSEGSPREDVTGTLVARKPGRWLTAWRDAKGRLKAARTVGDHWMGAGRKAGVEPVAGLVDEPFILARGDGVLAAWRDGDGHAMLANLDETGRVNEAPRDLGPALGAPGLSRGGGEAATFVVTTDSKGHVLLLDRNGAKPVDLTAALKAPPAAGAAAAWHWPLEGSRHITYRDASGAVHEYLELKGRWFHAALSARTGAPAAATDPIGYAPADHEHVIYLGVDGHVHELCFDAVEWHHNDLTAIAGAPASAGRPAGAYVAGRHCVVFRGGDGKAHCLRLRRDWRHFPLVDLGAIADDPQLASCGGEGAISYRGVDGQRRWARFGGDPTKAGIADLPA
jgi:hypothetical protein